MPVQDSWVELWLRRYCAPGKHRFGPSSRPRVLRCDLCGKEELPGGATCLICGIPGERQFVLRSLVGPETLEGKLCGPCLDDFRERETIQGWTIEAAG
jgi:hypothetical protein